MTLKRRVLFSAAAAILALSTASALAGDWAFGVSFGYGRSYYHPCYPRAVYYSDCAPAVVYQDYDYCPDVVTYVPPRAYYYDYGYYPRTVVYRDYPRYYHNKTAYFSRSYAPSYRADFHGGYRGYRSSSYSHGHYQSSGGGRGHSYRGR